MTSAAKHRESPRTPEKKGNVMKKEMLINVAQPEECRIAIVEDGVLEELYIERASQDNYVGNIYKGKVVNLEPSIQAAFVDFGVGRNGFLHISDVEPQYYRQGGYDPANLGDDTGHDEDTEFDDTSSESHRDRGGSKRPQRTSSRPRFKPPIRRSSVAATKCSYRSSRKASAIKARRCRPTSASPAAIWS